MSQEKFSTLVEVLQSKLTSTQRMIRTILCTLRCITGPSKPLNCEMVTDNKSNLGANAIFGVSLTLEGASAHTANSLLYRTLADGRKPVCPAYDEHKSEKHAGNDLPFQELMAIQTGFKTFRDTLRCGAEIYHALRAGLRLKLARQKDSA